MEKPEPIGINNAIYSVNDKNQIIVNSIGDDPITGTIWRVKNLRSFTKYMTKDISTAANKWLDDYENYMKSPSPINSGKTKVTGSSFRPTVAPSTTVKVPAKSKETNSAMINSKIDNEIKVNDTSNPDHISPQYINLDKNNDMELFARFSTSYQAGNDDIDNDNKINAILNMKLTNFLKENSIKEYRILNGQTSYLPGTSSGFGSMKCVQCSINIAYIK